jgi:hypothetical protein
MLCSSIVLAASSIYKFLCENNFKQYNKFTPFSIVGQGIVGIPSNERTYMVPFYECVGLYYGGYVFSMGCFHPEICMQNYWHAAMHVIGSAGHHIVLWI